MTHQGAELATKPDNLSAVLGTHMWKENKTLYVVF